MLYYTFIDVKNFLVSLMRRAFYDSKLLILMAGLSPTVYILIYSLLLVKLEVSYILHIRKRLSLTNSYKHDFRTCYTFSHNLYRTFTYCLTLPCLSVWKVSTTQSKGASFYLKESYDDLNVYIIT